MDFRHLRSFIALAEELHQGQAAARLGVEQPSLSRQIRELEEELGVQLFHRTTRRTWLSEAGEALLADARRMLADEQMTRERIRAGWATAKRLRIGFSEGFVGAPIGALLNYLEAKPADVRTALIERPLAELVAMLKIGAIDAIFAPEQAATSDTLSLPGWSEPLMALLPARIAGSRAIGLGDLDLPMFLPDPAHLPGYTRQLLAILPDGCRFAASRFASVATLYALVGTGHGMGMLPLSLAMSSARVTVRPIRAKRARMSFWLTIRKDDDTPAVVLLRAAVELGIIRAAPPNPAWPTP